MRENACIVYINIYKQNPPLDIMQLDQYRVLCFGEPSHPKLGLDIISNFQNHFPNKKNVMFDTLNKPLEWRAGWEDISHQKTRSEKKELREILSYNLILDIHSPDSSEKLIKKITFNIPNHGSDVSFSHYYIRENFKSDTEFFKDNKTSLFDCYTLGSYTTELNPKTRKINQETNPKINDRIIHLVSSYKNFREDFENNEEFREKVLGETQEDLEDTRLMRETLANCHGRITLEELEKELGIDV